VVCSAAAGVPSRKYSPTTFEDSCRLESAEEIAGPGSDEGLLRQSPDKVKWAPRIVFRSAERLQLRRSPAVAMPDGLESQHLQVDVDGARFRLAKNWSDNGTRFCCFFSTVAVCVFADRNENSIARDDGGRLATLRAGALEG
jgi:hypothetical protein